MCNVCKEGEHVCGYIFCTNVCVVVEGHACVYLGALECALVKLFLLGPRVFLENS